MQLLPVDVYHEVSCYLCNSDLLPLMLTCKDISNVVRNYLHPTQEDLEQAIETQNIPAIRSLQVSIIECRSELGR